MQIHILLQYKIYFFMISLMFLFLFVLFWRFSPARASQPSSGQPAQLRPASPAQASQPSPRGPGCSPMSIYQSEVWSIGSCRKSMHCQKTRAPRPSAMIYTYIYIYIYIYIFVFLLFIKSLETPSLDAQVHVSNLHSTERCH